MNNYFSKLAVAVNLSSKENNESNLTTLLKNLPDEKYDQSYGYIFRFTKKFLKKNFTFCAF